MNSKKLWQIFFILLFFTVVMGFVAFEEGAHQMFDVLGILGAVATFILLIIIISQYDS